MPACLHCMAPLSVLISPAVHRTTPRHRPFWLGVGGATLLQPTYSLIVSWRAESVDPGSNITRPPMCIGWQSAQMYIEVLQLFMCPDNRPGGAPEAVAQLSDAVALDHQRDELRQPPQPCRSRTVASAARRVVSASSTATTGARAHHCQQGRNKLSYTAEQYSRPITPKDSIVAMGEHVLYRAGQCCQTVAWS